MKNELGKEAVGLLIDLINTPSLSGEEDKTALILERFLERKSISFNRNGNNIWSLNQCFDASKPSILLNSHHDTVKPNKGYTRDPYKASIEDGKLFGLGSNDAGGCLVSLISAFIYFYQKKDLKYNLVLLASAEEENSGENGIRSMIPLIPEIDFAIVGEPTLLDLAIAEKGLLVLDCYAHGEAGHAAHIRGDHAINKAMRAINWFESYTFPKISETLKDTKMTVTQINAGSQHNVVPATCHFVVDIRVNDHYSNEEVLSIVKDHVSVEVKERSLNLNSSSIPENHEIVQAGIKMGKQIYGSPTLSDQANLKCPSLKLGPGDSLRSHKADEFIYEEEIYQGIELYIKLLEQIL
ncbi:M20 family metallo-hydrolase [Lutimonas saemankumensis]|uniref:M20 family metallo-hydrolase n=1 Tax=Lutimonas saemankumensis TaxID=483016 RepID=UPI001CD7A934|nr:M20 family metallo-hydrolase [Lutimonas saemankumensis]MCA0933475.1 M20 family metallo-hydrolase [Lutimonas saemankumensis]